VDKTIPSVLALTFSGLLALWGAPAPMSEVANTVPVVYIAGSPVHTDSVVFFLGKPLEGARRARPDQLGAVGLGDQVAFDGGQGQGAKNNGGNNKGEDKHGHPPPPPPPPPPFCGFGHDNDRHCHPISRP
jgi:hypothetical protein